MNDFERELFRAKRRRTAHRRLGTESAQCQICGETDPHVLAGAQDDHMAGWKYDDTTAFLCRNCHVKRTELQREEPPGGSGPPNICEWAARWLYSFVQYLELMLPKLRIIADLLMEFARRGYVNELSFS